MIIAGQKISNKILLIAISIFILLVGIAIIVPKIGDNTANKIPKIETNLPAIGLIPDLKTAMRSSGDLHSRVDLLMTYDDMRLFANYREVNSLVSEIIFLWSGLSLEELKKMNANQAIEFFLRSAYGVSPDRPIKNNPYLGKRPWATQFNRIKARLLMMGQGKNIYDGKAYFDSSLIRMSVEGNLSDKFVKEFARFLKSQKDPKNYRNNFLIFIDETKGWKNLSKEDRELISHL